MAVIDPTTGRRVFGKEAVRVQKESQRSTPEGTVTFTHSPGVTITRQKRFISTPTSQRQISEGGNQIISTGISTQKLTAPLITPKTQQSKRQAAIRTLERLTTRAGAKSTKSPIIKVEEFKKDFKKAEAFVSKKTGLKKLGAKIIKKGQERFNIGFEKDVASKLRKLGVSEEKISKVRKIAIFPTNVKKEIVLDLTNKPIENAGLVLAGGVFAKGATFLAKGTAKVATKAPKIAKALRAAGKLGAGTLLAVYGKAVVEQGATELAEKGTVSETTADLIREVSLIGVGAKLSKNFKFNKATKAKIVNSGKEAKNVLKALVKSKEAGGSLKRGRKLSKAELRKQTFNIKSGRKFQTKKESSKAFQKQLKQLRIQVPKIPKKAPTGKTKIVRVSTDKFLIKSGKRVIGTIGKTTKPKPKKPSVGKKVGVKKQPDIFIHSDTRTGQIQLVAKKIRSPKAVIKKAAQRVGKAVDLGVQQKQLLKQPKTIQKTKIKIEEEPISLIEKGLRRGTGREAVRQRILAKIKIKQIALEKAKTKIITIKKVKAKTKSRVKKKVLVKQINKINAKIKEDRKILLRLSRQQATASKQEVSVSQEFKPRQLPVFKIKSAVAQEQKIALVPVSIPETVPKPSKPSKPRDRRKPSKPSPKPIKPLKTPKKPVQKKPKQAKALRIPLKKLMKTKKPIIPKKFSKQKQKTQKFKAKTLKKPRITLLTPTLLRPKKKKLLFIPITEVFTGVERR